MRDVVFTKVKAHTVAGLDETPLAKQDREGINEADELAKEAAELHGFDYLEFERSHGLFINEVRTAQRMMVAVVLHRNESLKTVVDAKMKELRERAPAASVVESTQFADTEPDELGPNEYKAWHDMAVSWHGGLRSTHSAISEGVVECRNTTT